MNSSTTNRSHSEWRKIAKKMRRKKIRQRNAIERNKQTAELERSPTYIQNQAKQRLLQDQKRAEEEQARYERNLQWLKDEEKAQAVWKERLHARKLAAEEREKELKRIKKEWEAENKKQKEQEQLQKKLEEEQKLKQMKIQERIEEFIVNGGKVPKELVTGRESNPGKPLCPFFSKVGACRFGPRCSRNHVFPGISNVLLIPGFYTHFTLAQDSCTEYDTDVGLEFEDSDMYQHFKEFYNDVVPELKNYGHVTLVKVCCNLEPHLRGNVYVEYTSERDALVAYKKFHGRWYGGKQISVEFTKIKNWNAAICGAFFRKNCSKGKSCNFLHVLKNPRNEFPVYRSNQNRVNLSVEHGDRRRLSRDRDWRWSETPERFNFTLLESKQKNRNRQTSTEKKEKEEKRVRNVTQKRERQKTPERYEKSSSQERSRSKKRESHEEKESHEERNGSVRKKRRRSKSREKKIR